MIRPGDRDRIPIDNGVNHAVDTDLNGRPDTVLLPDPVELALLADTDEDGLEDLFIRIGPDGSASTTDLTCRPGAVVADRPDRRGVFRPVLAGPLMTPPLDLSRLDRR
jgi:hypothetical protein